MRASAMLLAVLWSGCTIPGTVSNEGDESGKADGVSASEDDGSGYAHAGVEIDSQTPSLIGRAVPACTPTPATLFGVDVSHYQGAKIDWVTVKAHASFAFAKATEGTGNVDATFSTNWRGMSSASLVRGAYHFFHASQDAIAQADHFLRVLAENGGLLATDLPPVLDVEAGGADGQSAATIIAGTRAFIDRVKQISGRTVLVYTGPSFWSGTLGDPDVGDSPLWIASYNGRSCPTMATGFKSWAFWQYTDQITLAGIAGKVDADLFAGTVDELLAFANGN